MLDIERFRVGAELEAYAILERKDRAAMQRFEPQKKRGGGERRALLSRALLLTETMAPDAYGAGREAMAALGVDDRLELYQSESAFGGAQTVLNGDPIGIEFFGDYLARHDRPALLAVMGHEIGHVLAHDGHAKYGWALPTCQHAKTPVRRAYAMAAELTADRLGLIACRDLQAALRLEMQGATGTVSSGIRFDTDAYLEQCRAFAEETLKNDAPRVATTHPEHYLRGYAAWLFWESDVYRDLTGLGPGTRKLADVDLLLRPLVGLPLQETPAKRLAPKRAFEAVTDFARRLRGPTAPATNELAMRFQEHVRSKKK